MKKTAPPILAIVGPTASGKTEHGLRLAKKQNGEIISVDSRQVYQFLSVGTAKPNGAWDRRRRHYIVSGIPHHLVDIWDPALPFTASDFIRLATAAIASIRARGKTPILVGGTGLYLKVLMEGLAPLPQADEALRKQLRTLAETKGRAFLHAELAAVDREAAARIPVNNIHRVMRALEVHRLTGKPLSEWHREHQASRTQGPFPQIRITRIMPSREVLHRRIEKRSAAMLKNGMIEETEQLLKKGYAPDCQALTGLGYRRVVTYLNDKLTREQLLALLIQDTKQYAKRQMTWFRTQLKASEI